MKAFLLGLREKAAETLTLSGGKGASLVRLSTLPGVPVPCGFVVTAPCYGEVAAGQPRMAALLEQLDGTDRADREQLMKLGKVLRTEISRISLPASLMAELESQVAEYGAEEAYAGRSSATAEDLPGASFAGQQDTFLNVRGMEEISRAIVGCWASLFNDRAIAYRKEQGFSNREVSIAVVVQRMVKSQVSGVLFTADPTTSDRRTLVVEAVRGLGEQLVSGRATPFCWRLRDGALRAEGPGEPPLLENQVLELARLGRKVESAFGGEQDIEWCYDGTQFWLVQARPITTLFPCPPSPDGCNHCAMSVGHLQMMTDAVRPLGISMLQASRFFSLMELGGHMYMDITSSLRSASGRRKLLSEAQLKDPLLVSLLREIYGRKDYLRCIPRGKAESIPVPNPLGLLAGALHIFRTGREEEIEAYFARQQREVETARKALEGLHGAAVPEWIMAEQKHMYRVLYEPTGAGGIVAAMLWGWRIDKAAQALTGETGASQQLSRSVPHNFTSEMGLELCRVSDVARRFPAVVDYLERAGENFSLSGLRTLPGGEETAQALEEYLQRYGMRCTGEIDITRPRFREQPEQLAAALCNNIRHLPQGHAQTAFLQGRREAEELAERLIAEMTACRGARKGAQLKRLIQRYRAFVGLREAPKYFWVCHYDVYRQAILREAEELVRRGVLEEREDVYYLTLEELAQTLRTGRVDRETITARRGAWRRYETLNPPRIIFSDGEVPPVRYDTQIPAGALGGLGVSGGVIEGRARVVERLSQAQLEPGDILVTTYTDPSWTPVFVSIAGLVTEVGGMMSHGAVITREYGLPAVVGVVDATKKIRDGQRIRLDGAKGYVQLLDENCQGKKEAL